MTDDTDERGEEYVARQRSIAAELTREGQAMAHLPECPVVQFYKPTGVCICDRLRACEARVRAFYDAEIERQGAQWEASCRQYYRSGSDDGKSLALDAARDAVAALGRYAMPEDWLVGVDRKVVLAAIDALKGGTDD